MTIEDKAKLYDEALKKAKDVIEQNPLMEYLKKGIEYILPELKENGDEKIRKWLIDTIKQVPNDSIEWETIDKSSVLAWLEKQREQDPCEHCADKRLNCHNFPCVKGRAFKQGKSVFDIINEEKVDNTNKIETKFKDGNVLYSPTHHLIWIYKDNEHYYACVNMNYVKDNVFTEGLIVIPEDACPANKLQQDILFSKIKEAGYEWDADKKELKKIEQKSVEWSEEDEKLLKLSFENLTELKDMYGEEYGKVGDCISWLKSLKDRHTWKPSEEQLDALQYVYRNLNPPLSDKLGWNSLKTLELMYHDLKKLK